MQRILVIDDSEIVLETTREALEDAGYGVVTAQGVDDFHAAKGERLDLILLDINMPDVFGDDVAAFFRDQWEVRAPIYFFSDLPDEELAERAQAAGVEGFVAKSGGVDHLLDRVRRILSED